jgi:glycosyltransferase involved in cell wall biosynthesis
MNKIAFVSFNQPNRYSGGRIHGLWLAYAFAANGYDVDFYTNCIPVFWRNMPSTFCNHIHFIVNRFFIWCTNNGQYQQIVVVPHVTTWKKTIIDRLLFNPFVSRLKKRNNVPLWYLDFESPNWIYDTNPDLRPMSMYRNSNRLLKYCDIVISTTKTGLQYAQNYYSIYNKNIKYHQLYLAINTYAAEGIDYHHKDNMAMFFARFGQKHKNNEAIINIVESLPDGYHFAIMGNRDAAEPGLLSRLEKICKLKNILLCFHKNITDRKKFELLAKTKIFFFSSIFEGYGIPPLEAQYMGASVICSDLPVLREVNPMATFVDFDDKKMLIDAVNHLLKNQQNSDELRKTIETFASPEVFFKKLGIIINEINNEKSFNFSIVDGAMRQ